MKSRVVWQLLAAILLLILVVAQSNQAPRSFREGHQTFHLNTGFVGKNSKQQLTEDGPVTRDASSMRDQSNAGSNAPHSAGSVVINWEHIPQNKTLIVLPSFLTGAEVGDAIEFDVSPRQTTETGIISSVTSFGPQKYVWSGTMIDGK